MTQDRAKALQARKLETLGHMAGNVIHEINNVLTAITGLASMIQMRLPSQTPFRKEVEDILLVCHQGQELTRGVLSFVRKDTRREPFSLNQLVLQTVRILRGVSSDVRFEAVLDDDLPAVTGAPAQISLALVNLSLNAIEASGGSGVVKMSTDNVTVDRDAPSAFSGLSPGRYVRLRVSDSGNGMDAATRQCAVEPFHSTKPAGEGTGLGLSLVRDTILDHGGALGIDSELGKGTTVTIFLPAGASAPSTSS